MKKIKSKQDLKKANQELKVKALEVANLGKVIGGMCSCYSHRAW